MNAERPSLRQLEYAVALADTLSFRAAADRCFVSQPALSTQIQALEARLGARLFERDRRRVLLTDTGAMVVDRAREVIERVQGIAEAVRVIAQLGPSPSPPIAVRRDLDPASPAREITFNVRKNRKRTISVVSKQTGMASEMISVARGRRRKSHRPIMARATPMTRLVRRRLMARLMNTEASKDGAMTNCRSASRVSLISATSALTASRAARTLAPC